MSLFYLKSPFSPILSSGMDNGLLSSFPKLELIKLANDVAELNKIKDKEPEKIRKLLNPLEPVIKLTSFGRV